MLFAKIKFSQKFPNLQYSNWSAKLHILARIFNLRSSDSSHGIVKEVNSIESDQTVKILRLVFLFVIFLQQVLCLHMSSFSNNIK